MLDPVSGGEKLKFATLVAREGDVRNGILFQSNKLMLTKFGGDSIVPQVLIRATDKQFEQIDTQMQPLRMWHPESTNTEYNPNFKNDVEMAIALAMLAYISTIFLPYGIKNCPILPLVVLRDEESKEVEFSICEIETSLQSAIYLLWKTYIFMPSNPMSVAYKAGGLKLLTETAVQLFADEFAGELCVVMEVIISVVKKCIPILDDYDDHNWFKPLAFDDIATEHGKAITLGDGIESAMHSFVAARGVVIQVCSTIA